MYNYNCENAEKKQDGLLIGIYCKAINDWCGHQRWCSTKKDVELLPSSQTCPQKPSKV